MEISSLFIRVVFLLLPGIIASRLYRKLRGRTKKEVWHDSAEVLVFALVSYTACGILLRSSRLVEVLQFGSPATQPASGPQQLPTTVPAAVNPAAIEAFFNEQSPMPWGEIALASLISVALALAAAAAHHHRLVNRTAERWGVSNRTGDEDIWDFFHNSDLSTASPVFVRDDLRKLVYYARIKAFSESGESRELLLLDADVYTDDTFEKLYCCQAMYLSRPKFSLTIEVPQFEAEQDAVAPEGGSG